jgi:hypothetical protein
MEDSFMAMMCFKQVQSVAVFAAFLLAASCANKNKAENLDTKLDGAEKISGGSRVGIKNGEMVVQEKVELSERLRDLQNQVYSLQDKVYGSRKLDSKGLYGELRSCRSKLASRQYGGTGTLLWTEPMDRVTEKEEELKLGLDEGNNLVALKEEYLRDRVGRFTGYKTILEKREDDLTSSIEQCRVDLKDRELDVTANRRVSITDAPKISADTESINKYLCGFAKEGASLQTLLLNVFGHGWMSVADLNPESPILSGQIHDSKGGERNNGLTLGEWRLAFDHGEIRLQDILAGNKDARLKAWASSSKCLARADGSWNP